MSHDNYFNTDITNANTNVFLYNIHPTTLSILNNKVHYGAHHGDPPTAHSVPQQ